MQGKRIVVLGGNGYLGQRIVNCALKKGVSVVSVSRSGTAPPQYSAPSNLLDNVNITWHKGDVFDTSSWLKQLDGSEAVVSCLGAFGSNEFMEKMNGDANILAANESKTAGVGRFVYISTVENNLPEAVLKGYFNGKKRAEEAVLELYKEQGYILRPGFIYGSRTVPLPSFLPIKTAEIPLWLLGRPLEMILGVPGVEKLRDIPGMRAILAQPLSVDCVASVAVSAALGEIPPNEESATFHCGNILSIPDIIREFRTAAASNR